MGGTCDRIFRPHAASPSRERVSGGPDLQARLKAAMIGNAQRTYVVADSSKLGEHGLFHYWSELPADWGLVTDEGADPTVLMHLRAAGAQSIILAPPTGETW